MYVRSQLNTNSCIIEVQVCMYMGTYSTKYFVALSREYVNKVSHVVFNNNIYCLELADPHCNSNTRLVSVHALYFNAFGKAILNTIIYDSIMHLCDRQASCFGC